MIQREGARAVLVAQEAHDGAEPGSSRTQLREEIGAGAQVTAVDLRRRGTTAWSHCARTSRTGA